MVSWFICDGAIRVHAINALGRRKGRIIEIEVVDTDERFHGSARNWSEWCTRSAGPEASSTRVLAMDARHDLVVLRRLHRLPVDQVTEVELASKFLERMNSGLQEPRRCLRDVLATARIVSAILSLTVGWANPEVCAEFPLFRCGLGRGRDSA